MSHCSCSRPKNRMAVFATLPSLLVSKSYFARPWFYRLETSA